MVIMVIIVIDYNGDYNNANNDNNANDNTTTNNATDKIDDNTCHHIKKLIEIDSTTTILIDICDHLINCLVLCFKA